MAINHCKRHLDLQCKTQLANLEADTLSFKKACSMLSILLSNTPNLYGRPKKKILQLWAQPSKLIYIWYL